MPDFDVIEMKPFVPAKDFELSQRFYQDVGFRLNWHNEQMAYLHHGSARFLLQNFYEQAFAENLMLHLLVKDVDAWRQRLAERGVAERYGVRIGAVEEQPWGMREFVLFDPCGVLWRIGQSTD
ncbi:VOC family protein [Hydrogenophaga sp. YM1]|uniref:VOC family protein n=1 Tax=Hydrogenophaga sp. YM1 TaxID=2806262 RepID=UPI00195975F7|nr:VOC family protein [Hydrogenophaga sp. YM1]QRR36301.1 VOC family protein [Hydrogenophaga sp. YM1]